MQRIGSFRFWYDTDVWEWSDEVAALHGYAPGEITPTTSVLTEHKHPDDRGRFVDMVAHMRTESSPFSSRHRIIDTRGCEHLVAVIGQTFTDEHGQPVGTQGFYLDVSEFEHEAVKQQVDQQIRAFREHSAVIEQAKGMLMVVYGITADRAFDILRWRSQNDNIKLADICAGIVAEVSSRFPIRDDTRTRFDHIVLTAHLSTR